MGPGEKPQKKSMQIEPKKLHATQETLPTPHASPMAILISNLRVFKAIITISPAKTIVQFL